MFARIIGGLSKANVAVILAIVSDSTGENERNRAMVRRQTNRSLRKGQIRSNLIFLLTSSFSSISLPFFFQGMDWRSFFTWFYFWTIIRRIM